MISNLTAPAQWAQTEFALAELGDQRRTQRLVKMAASLAQTPHRDIAAGLSGVE